MKVIVILLNYGRSYSMSNIVTSRIPSAAAADGSPTVLPSLPTYLSPQDVESNIGLGFSGLSATGPANTLVKNLTINLRYCDGLSVSAALFPNLVTLDLPFLAQNGANSGSTRFTVSSFASLTAIRAPSYIKNSSSAGMLITLNPVLTLLSLPRFLGCFDAGSGALQITSNVALVTLSLPSLTKIAPGGLVITGNTALATFLAPLNAVVFQNPISTILNFSGNALSQATVDDILVKLAANTPFSTATAAVNLTGGTNSTPSATGLAAKATLVARSCTITHN